MSEVQRRGVWRRDGLPLWGNNYPDLYKGPIPIDYLHTQEYYDLEREKIFSKCWLYVGRIEEFLKQGYVVKEVPICKASVLITKDDVTGQLSAFHNICKHRLNKLVYDKAGSGGSFVCHYHAWSYDRKGKLRHVPEENAFHQLDKSKCDLTKVNVDVWRGFVFINLDPNPAETLVEYLGEVAEMLADYPFEEVFGGACVSLQGEMDVNWKVGQQTNMETYHAYKLHVDHMLGGGDRFQFGDGSSPIDMKLMKRHRYFAYGFKSDGSADSAPPTMKLVAEMADASSLNALPNDADLMEAKHRKYPGTNHTNHTYWAGDNYFIFPNLLLHAGPDMVQTLSYDPLSVDRSLCKNAFYFPKAETAGQLFASRLFVSTQLNVICNDMWAGERVQEGLKTGAADEMMLMDSELCIMHEYQVYKEAVEA